MTETRVSLAITILTALISCVCGISATVFWVGGKIAESDKDRAYLTKRFDDLEAALKESTAELKLAQDAILKTCCSEMYVINDGGKRW
mgnify:CR=1 FL=1